MRKVTFLSRVQAQALTPPPGSVIISVHDQSDGPAQLKEGWADRLTLEFHDTDGQTLGLTCFDQPRARQVWDFVAKHKDSASELFVHCQMGVSRSGAIALAVSELLSLPCFRQSQRVTWETHTTYNRKVYSELVISYADQQEQEALL